MTYSTLTVDLSRIISNYVYLSQKAAPSKIMAILKANAYGLGALPIASALSRAGCHSFGLAHLDEISQLRHAGISGEMLHLTPIKPNEVETLLDLRAIATIYQADQGISLSNAATARGIQCDVLIKVDTGMGRYGIAVSSLPELMDKIGSLPGIRIGGCYSHLACADSSDQHVSHIQVKAYEEACDILRLYGIDDPAHSLANSAGILRGIGTTCRYSRPGILLYGGSPGAECHRPLDILSPSRWTAGIRQIKRVSKGVGLSYGHTYVTTRETLVATVPVGYADGLPRSLSNRGFLIVNGQAAPVIGKVAMDHTLLDITDISGVTLESEVILMGDELSPEEIAEKADRLCYEVLTGINQRVGRRYLLES